MQMVVIGGPGLIERTLVSLLLDVKFQTFVGALARCNVVTAEGGAECCRGQARFDNWLRRPFGATERSSRSTRAAVTA